jgi:uncharacterized membrane protein
MAALIAVYSIAFIAVTAWRYNHFIAPASGDLLLFEQVVYNTAHGRPFYNNFSMQNHFGDHNSPILALLAVFSYLIPVHYALYVFTVLAVAISAIPIYLICEETFDRRWIAVVLGACYLMLPALVGLSFQAFHEINLVLPFLTFAFYFFAKERFYPFLAMMLMSLLVKEDVALTLFMFAPYALIKRRGWRWSVAPALLSVSWFLVSVKVIIPFFNKSAAYGVGLGYFSSFGHTISGIAANMAANPGHTLQVMASHTDYLFWLLLPFGLLLPFFSPEILFAIPCVVFNLLSDSDRFRVVMTRVGSDDYFFPSHMSLVACGFLFMATVYAAKKISLRANSEKPALALIVVIAGLVLYSDRFVTIKYNYVRDDFVDLDPGYEAAVNTSLSRIPLSATVTSSRAISTHLYDRKESYSDMTGTNKADYIVVTPTAADLSIKNHPDFKANYQLTYAEDDVQLYKRK